MSTPAVAAADRPFADVAEVEELVAGFEACTLPKPRWTHRAHLAVGLCYCERLGADEALSLLRERIRRYNLASGGVNTATAGYHETVTRFYVWIVRRFVEEDREGGDLAARANRLYRRYGARDLPKRYYSESRLMSAEARAGWVEPDLRPLAWPRPARLTGR